MKFYPYLEGGAPPAAEKKVIAGNNVPMDDGSGAVKESLNMEFRPGFMGVRQDKQSFNVKPEIGWAEIVKRKASSKAFFYP